MTKKSTCWVCEEAQFKDYKLDFPYRIIHEKGNVDYLCGNLGSALAEYNVFKDHESLTYFYALLANSHVLIPVSKKTKKRLKGLLTIWRDVDEKGIELIPDIFPFEDKKLLPVFTSVRQIFWVPTVTNRKKPDGKPKATQTFIYIEFEKIYDWIRQNSEKIDFVVFDAADKREYSLAVGMYDFLYVAECAIGHFCYRKDTRARIETARLASLNKHMPQKRNKQ